ncbi:MAG: sigma-54 dependent transcriptional regulator, partial [Bacteroidota bacterium]|nr:sigma-54 dependent transcriptional regulator [Bacteroidota bacterium]
MVPARILVVDDNVQILESLRILLKEEFEAIDVITKPTRISEMLWRNSYDVIMLDMNFAMGETSGNEGIFWLNEIKKKDPLLPIILITAYAEIELAVRAIQEGATDFIAKPWDPDKLIVTLNNAYKLRKSGQEVKKLKNKQQQLSEDLDRQYKMMHGSSVRMIKLMQTVDRVAATDANVLILGENGTGKELAARALHRQSNRANEVFISVDMAALTDTLFESELFGHVKGAFTDAKEDRAGRFEIAAGGTLFLDEIGNLSLPLQAKLLTVLENRQVTRLGSNKPHPVDIRLICATNRPIHEMAAQETFRRDLLYRMNTVEIPLPPLRERLEDIPLLVDHFLRMYGKKYQKPPKRV